MMRAVLGGVLAASLLVSPAFAQSSSGTWNGLHDRFQIDTGYFRLSADTQLRYNGGAGLGGRQLREGPRRRQEREHVLGGRHLAGRAAPPAQARLHRAQPRPARLRARARLHLGRRDLSGRALGLHVDRRRHPRRLLPLRPRPQRTLRDRPDPRHRLPLAEREGPGDGDDRRREPHARRARHHRQRHRSRRRLRERLAHEAPRHARGLPLHQGVAGRLGERRSPTGGSGRTTTSSRTRAWAFSTSTTSTATTAASWSASWAATSPTRASRSSCRSCSDDESQ